MVEISTKTKMSLAWQWMCQQEVFDSVTLSQQVELSRNYASHLVRKWHESGHLTQHGRQGATFYYEVSQRATTQPPGWGAEPISTRKKRRGKRKSRQQKMWNSMKISRTFTKLELVMTADTTARTVEGYIHALVKAGYLKMLSPAIPSKNIPTKYLLLRDTGRFAPMRRKNGCWDQNQQRLYPYLVEEGTHGNVA
ncbi:hypothetical protein [Aeromonas caviae]|uniref:hypothetical protein n=1 Tax=Aeromonas caviae TaxID=648 RepID=UPI000FEB7F45|nr:hypothetical protein [Aeromonas caviae]